MFEAASAALSELGTNGRAERAADAGRVQGPVRAKLLIGNPDLPRRLAEGLPLAPDDKETWYTGGARGYADYSTFTATRPAAT